MPTNSRCCKRTAGALEYFVDFCFLMLICTPPNLVSLPEQVAKTIADSIMKLEIEPGASLREIPLSKFFGVSRSSVREALRILERDGVVSIRPRHGAKVTELSPDEMAEIYQIRGALRGVACGLFASKCTQDDLRFLDETLAKMAVIAVENEQAHALIHAELSASMATYICDRCANSRLMILLRQMSLQVARYTTLGLSSESRRRQSLENWSELLIALRMHDATRASQCGQKLVSDNLAYALLILQPDHSTSVDNRT
jgi:DNA-binding GntR family transcriptional regulator